MPRLFLITWSCFLFVCCDKQGSSVSQNRESSPTTKSSILHLTSRQERAELPSKPLREMIAEADALSPVEREKALAAIVWDAIETDQEIAHEAFGKMLPASPDKIRLIQHYAIRFAAQNFEEAIEWAETLENEMEKSAALSHIAVAIAETNPIRAANLLADADIPSRDFEVAIVQVIQRWAAKSPEEAAAWITMFHPSAVRQAGINIIAERWLPRDSVAAFAWMEKMTDATLRQETARAMQGVILQQAPEVRDTWRQHASQQIRTELEQQSEAALMDVGDNITKTTDYKTTP